MIHTLDHKNNASMGFPMSENLGIYSLIIIIPAILAKIHRFQIFIFCWKNEYPVPHKSSISEKRPRVPAWHPSDSDSTWSHDIKSIKTHCGTFTARLPQTSTRLKAGCSSPKGLPVAGTTLGKLTAHFKRI